MPSTRRSQMFFLCFDVKINENVDSICVMDTKVITDMRFIIFVGKCTSSVEVFYHNVNGLNMNRLKCPMGNGRKCIKLTTSFHLG